MKHSLLVMVIPGVAWAWSYYRQENFGAKDHLQEILSWVFMGGIGLFMLTILYKALVSRPKCPTCQRKMREVETITISEKQLINMKEETSWRVVDCPHCGDKYRIPGLS
ncbi:hypothetical protein N9920_00830 [Akkermansiaceae bacterium]|nr:hypothetical protein [Akkermansiaceae bacterium]MDA7538045.1 hypothetical protein [Akkermansiaceae bacterium]MDB4312698.1 hypothetical protein [Akkermansiaceae bacterium]MDB4731986.1 hypothetical protein [bacterium]